MFLFPCRFSKMIDLSLSLSLSLSNLSVCVCVCVCVCVTERAMGKELCYSDNIRESGGNRGAVFVCSWETAKSHRIGCKCMCVRVNSVDRLHLLVST